MQDVLYPGSVLLTEVRITVNIKVFVQYIIFAQGRRCATIFDVSENNNYERINRINMYVRKGFTT